MPLDPLILVLKARRETLGLSQRELAFRLGYSQNTIYYWEAGRSDPTLKKLRDWSQALGVTLEIKDA
jgi:transcriptional regulator with XRE-family HTH domain